MEDKVDEQYIGIGFLTGKKLEFLGSLLTIFFRL